MSITIQQFTLDFSTVQIQLVTMPLGSEIIALRMDDEALLMWCLADSDTTVPPETRAFKVYTTGDVIEPFKKYVGTFRTKDAAGNPVVNHVFEV